MVAFFILPGLCCKLNLQTQRCKSAMFDLSSVPCACQVSCPPRSGHASRTRMHIRRWYIYIYFILHTFNVQFLLVAEVSTVSEGPKNKYERLENRISSSFVIYVLAPIIILKPDELEMLLRQKENDSGRSHSPSNGHLAGLLSHISVSPPLMIMWTHRNAFTPPFALWSYQ